MKRIINENWKFLNLCFEAFSLLMCLALAVASGKTNSTDHHEKCGHIKT